MLAVATGRGATLFARFTRFVRCEAIRQSIRMSSLATTARNLSVSFAIHHGKASRSLRWRRWLDSWFRCAIASLVIGIDFIN
ncbi:MAG: hypothetical protein JNM83_17620 [Myxococcales bacterium]|nr:hypothetical protein [Myxococcales bacterium]